MEACQPIYHDLRKVLAFLDLDGAERSGSVTDSRQQTTRRNSARSCQTTPLVVELSINRHHSRNAQDHRLQDHVRYLEDELRAKPPQGNMSRSSYRTTTPSVFQVLWFKR